MASNTGSPRLEITIDAITVGLKKGLEDARKELKNFNDEVKRGGSPDFKSALQAEKVALAQSRTEAQQARTAIAQLALAKKQGQSATVALSGSYREAQQRLTALGRSIREAQGGFTNTTPAIRAQISEYNALNSKLKEFDKQMGLNYRNVGNYSSAFVDAIPGVNQFTSVVGAVGAGIAALNKSFTTNLKLDALNYAIRQVSGDAINFDKNMSFLRETSERLGLEFVSTAEAFKSWQGSARFANITSDESRRIFESVANAGAKMKLSADDVRGAFRALEQMMSKGKVQAEELRGQLGERLPGAFALAAKAMGVTQAELNKMLETGQVVATDFLPKFATELDRSFGNDKTQKIESMQASVNRLSNEFTNLWQSENATQFFTSVTNGLTEMTSRMNKLVNTGSWEEFWLRVSSLATSPVEMLFGLDGVGEEADKVRKAYDDVQRQTAKGSNFFGFSGIQNLRDYVEQNKVVKKSVEETTKVVDNLNNKISNKKTGGKTQTKTSDILGDLAGVEGNEYDKRIAKINQEYTKLVEKINQSVGSKEDISEALRLAKVKHDFDSLKVSVDRSLDSVKKFQVVTGNRGVELSGTLTTPSTLPLLERNQERLNRPILAKFDDDFTKQFRSTLRRGLSETFNNLFSDIANMGDKAYDIEKKYAELRENASSEQIDDLRKMERLEKSINSGITSILSKVANSFTSIGGNMLTSAISTGISSGDFKDLSSMFSGKNKAMGFGALGSLAGGLIQGSTKKTSVLGQGLGGALAGAGTGAAIGSVVPVIGTAIGAVAGAIIGGLAGVLGASKKRREEELMELQLAEQKKLVALQERQQALAYASSIIGQQVNGGIVTAVDRDSFGNLVAKINGKDIELVLERTKNSRG